MSKTLTDKLAAIRDADAAYQAAIADLTDATTGEALAPGESAVDLSTEATFTNASGVVVRGRPRVVVRAEATGT